MLYKRSILIFSCINNTKCSSIILFRNTNIYFSYHNIVISHQYIHISKRYAALTDINKYFREMININNHIKSAKCISFTVLSGIN
jgi:hypothetical protein